MLKKTAISLAAVSMMIAPVAVLATPALSTVAFDNARTTSTVNDKNKLEGSSWLLALLVAAAAVGGIAIAAGGGDNSPASP